jgi:hypothetical protein
VYSKYVEYVRIFLEIRICRPREMHANPRLLRRERERERERDAQRISAATLLLQRQRENINEEGGRQAGRKAGKEGARQASRPAGANPCLLAAAKRRECA